MQPETLIKLFRVPPLVELNPAKTIGEEEGGLHQQPKSRTREPSQNRSADLQKVTADYYFISLFPLSCPARMSAK